MHPTIVRRRRRRGVTLLEVLVVVAIMSLIAAAVGVAAFRKWREAQVRTATANARTIRGEVRSWWLTTGRNDCPTVEDLIDAQALDEDSPRTDPWGNPWRIDCANEAVSVGSDGPDRVVDTEDDIRVPPLGRGASAAAPEDTS